MIVRPIHEHQYGGCAVNQHIDLSAHHDGDPPLPAPEYFIRPLPDYLIRRGTGDHLATLRFHSEPSSATYGVTCEALLAIVLDRLRSHNEGPTRCRENSCAITKIEEALHWLAARTADRRARGVEGTDNP